MPSIKDFLSKEDETAIVAAIKTAETNTSGEIRVHIEKGTDKDDFDRALEVFQMLEMHKTELQNGVLIYVAVEKRTFVICGDKGINDVVPDNFWDSTKDEIINQFKQGNFKQGLVDGILKAGEQLKAHFPYQDDDVNELPDEISKG
ncbi:TLP18.3, Psb32 and MOLO-1 founding protein of phosphatase [Pustulibacterium marinum]|uniref:TLP18.3, Psb32 and MOLO-1 founding protein of phosphatase n=1 Tax=Pustulibacterium marinum TaxID=1224947 RepID=A0A1I7F314_9FLAO|nr:TPM domain-containing protein [Pustulibacterium marinum]SFU30550.1 TLP18.3, Psb32 and MOLO-1 founding protein of phosphatase [Pustulibacterium marinum]